MSILIITPYSVLLGIIVLALIELLSGIYFIYKLQRNKIELLFGILLMIKLIILIIFTMLLYIA